MNGTYQNYIHIIIICELLNQELWILQIEFFALLTWKRFDEPFFTFRNFYSKYFHWIVTKKIDAFSLRASVEWGKRNRFFLSFRHENSFFLLPLIELALELRYSSTLNHFNDTADYLNTVKTLFRVDFQFYSEVDFLPFYLCFAFSPRWATFNFWFSPLWSVKTAEILIENCGTAVEFWFAVVISEKGLMKDAESITE